MAPTTTPHNATHDIDESPSPARRERLPWPSLLVLGAATLTMVTAEMLPTVVLEPMSDGLDVSEPRTAQLVSLWALVVVIASFPLVRLTRRWDRRRVILTGLLALGASSVVTAVAPTFAVAVGGRLLGATAVGLLWATINAHVADLVPDRLLGPAVAVVLGGATLGIVIGTPLGRLVADVAGWRASFVVLAGTALVVTAAVRTVVPSTARPPGDPTPSAPTSDRTLRPVLVVAGLAALTLTGHYGAYTFVTRLTEPPATSLPGGMSTLLLVFGISSAAGVALAGRSTGTAHRLALPGAVVLTSVALLALALVGSPVGLGVVVLWGVTSGALPPLAQTEILRLAGSRHRDVAGAVIPVVFNGGIAVGAAAASLVVDRAGLAMLPYSSAAIAAAAAVGLVSFQARRRPGRVPPESGTVDDAVDEGVDQGVDAVMVGA